MTPPVLPGSLRDLLAVGMTVYADSKFLHHEHDPEVWRPAGGIVHSIGNEDVGTIAVGLKGHPNGMAHDVFTIDNIHDCDDEHCLYRPQPPVARDVRYAARWVLRIVGGGRGRLGLPDSHDRRLIRIAVALLTKGVL